MCGNFQHKTCDDLYAANYCEDGTWLCRVCSRCHRVERAWGREDFDYEEIDPSYDIGNAYKRGEGGTKKKEPPSRPEKDTSPETINSNDDEIMIL